MENLGNVTEKLEKGPKPHETSEEPGKLKGNQEKLQKH